MKSANGRVQVVVEGAGSLVLVRPLNATVRRWLTDRVVGETTWLGPSLVVELRYVEALLQGLQDHGFRVKVH